MSVSSTSAPASIIELWTPSITSGRLRIERLVAAARQAVVLLEAQLELLERRAHAAVEDEDAVADRGEEVAHRFSDATKF